MDDNKRELRKQQREQEDFVIIKNIIDDIFNTRYRIDDIYKKNFSARESIEKIIYNTSFLDDNFGIGTKEKVKNKIAENALIREKKPRNSILIEDRWDIFVAAKDLYYLNESNYNLDYALNYFNLPLNLFKKLLHEISIYPFFEEEIRNRVKLLLNEETDKKVK